VAAIDLTPYYTFDEDVIPLASPPKRLVDPFGGQCFTMIIRNGAMTTSFSNIANEPRRCWGLFL